MKVQDVKNVCIVCPPLVVIVHPVEEGDIQSEPLVAYDNITIPLHPVPPVEFTPPPHPEPVFAVAGEPFHHTHPFHHHAVHIPDDVIDAPPHPQA